MVTRVLKRRRAWLLPAVILVMAMALRTVWPTLTEFKFSEARLEALALEFTREGRLPLIGVPSSADFDHSPISTYLYIPAFLLTTNPIPATIYGGLVGTAAVALCWRLSRGWSGGSPTAALTAMLLFAVSPWAVAFSRKIWQVAFVPLFALAFIGLVIAALVEKRRWRLTWALVVYALLVQVHPSAWSLAPALALGLILFRREVKLGPLLVGATLGVLTGVPFLIHQVENDWPVLAAMQALPKATWDLSAIRLAWDIITGRGIHALAGDAYPLLRIVPQLSWMLNILGWLTIGAVLTLTWQAITDWQATDDAQRQRARVNFVLLSWLVVPILLNLRHSLDLHLHFFAWLMPIAFIVIGRAADEIFASRRRRPLQAIGVAGLSTVAVVQIATLVLMARFIVTHDTIGGFGAPLSRYLSITDKTVAAAIQENAEVLVMGQGDSPVVHETPAIFDVLLRNRVAYRFTDGQAAALFPAHRAIVLLTPGAGEAARWYQSLSVPITDLGDGYQLASLDGTWPQEGFKAAAGPRLFQNGVEVQGHAWEAGKFWLLWQVLWLSQEDTHFFAQLVNDSGQQVGQWDAVGYPTAYRRKGDRIVSVFDINSPVATGDGPFRARVGLYTYPQVVNVPVIDSAGNPVSTVVTMGPLEKQQ